LNLLTLAQAFLSVVCISFGIRMMRSYPCSPIRTKLAEAACAAGLFELWDSFALVAQEPSLFMTFTALAASFSLAFETAFLAVILDLSEIRGISRALALFGPIVLALMQIAEAWRGRWVIAGFHPSVWGNVAELTCRDFPLAVREIYLFTAAGIGSAALTFAWACSPSPRRRRAAVRMLAGASLTCGACAASSAYVWKKWGYPDPARFVEAIGFLLCAYPIGRETAPSRGKHRRDD
jgi:hypothetical protein